MYQSGEGMFRLSTRYAALFVGLFLVETAIALWVHDRFVRPFVGDVLVVVLLYVGVRAIVDVPPRVTVAAVLGFAWMVELAQYFQVVDRLGLQDDPVLRVVIGRHFDPLDLLAYVCGAGLVLVGERWGRKKGD